MITLNRRQALKWFACTAAAGLASPVLRRPAALVDEIRARLEAALRDHEMGLIFARLNGARQEEFLVAIKPDRLYATASSFKAAAALYYFLNTPQAEWAYGEGSDAYVMAVFSNNASTALVLSEVAARLGIENPISAFNDFQIATFGLTNGLYSWTFESILVSTNGFTDPRFRPDRFATSQTAVQANNYSTPQEIAQVFRFLAQAESNPRWADPHFQASILAARTLLSMQIAGVQSPLERAIPYQDHYSKEGMVEGYVCNDAGIWLVPDGGAYLISFMSAYESTPAIQEALAEVSGAIAVYQQYLSG